jgi:tetratricopeptide (TPR) repeat protein
MDTLLPQAYLIGLIVLLGGASILIGLQIVRVRRDEAALARLEGQARTQGQDSGTLYELGSVQLRKRLYAQAADSFKLALKRSDGEPAEARALIQNALGFSLAAQGNYGSAVKHYKAALQAKADYPVALNNFGFALEKLGRPDEARQAYQQALELDPSNRTAGKRLKLLERRNPGVTAGGGTASGGITGTGGIKPRSS